VQEPELSNLFSPFFKLLPKFIACLLELADFMPECDCMIIGQSKQRLFAIKLSFIRILHRLTFFFYKN